MGRNPKNQKDRKTKSIKIYLTPGEFKIYQSHKKRLFDRSPTPSASDILRYVAMNIDDIAMLQFLKLDINSSIRTRLILDFNIETNKQIKNKEK